MMYVRIERGRYFMEWNESGIDRSGWRDGISNLDAKEKVAVQMASRLRHGDVVGVGSGSTSLLVLHALADKASENRWQFTAITTSIELEMACAELRVRTSSLVELRPDWSFDGADEIDAELNMIKGRGGAMLREKLIMASSPERYIVVDESKLVEQLGLKFPIPLELVPESLQLVRSQLNEKFDVHEVELRMAVGKDGPVITENRNLILDVRFDHVTPDLDPQLNSVPGIVGTGLFVGFYPTVISA
jgi:ribose 5-phosphate isomerase A